MTAPSIAVKSISSSMNLNTLAPTSSTKPIRPRRRARGAGASRLASPTSSSSTRKRSGTAVRSIGAPRWRDWRIRSSSSHAPKVSSRSTALRSISPDSAGRPATSVSSSRANAMVQVPPATTLRRPASVLVVIDGCAVKSASRCRNRNSCAGDHTEKARKIHGRGRFPRYHPGATWQPWRSPELTGGSSFAGRALCRSTQLIRDREPVESRRSGSRSPPDGSMRAIRFKRQDISPCRNGMKLQTPGDRRCAHSVRHRLGDRRAVQMAPRLPQQLRLIPDGPAGSAGGRSRRGSAWDQRGQRRSNAKTPPQNGSFRVSCAGTSIRSPPRP